MCLMSAPTPPAPPPVQPAPTREEVAAEVAADKIEMTNESKRKVAQRQGLFSNIRTTSLGDPLFGSSSTGIARFGGRA